MKDLELMQEDAYKIAKEYYLEKGGCSQCVLAGIMEAREEFFEDVFKSATGLAGGVLRTGSACGALTGAVLALGLYGGRDYSSFKDGGNTGCNTFELGDELLKKFKEEFSSLSCSGIKNHMMEDLYGIEDPKEKEEFIKSQKNKERCGEICGYTAKWVVEILGRNGY